MKRYDDTLKNQTGTFVEPDDTTFQAAAAGADWAKTFFQVLTDEPGKNAWPITGATFVLLQKVQDKPGQGTATLKFFDWAYVNGDKAAGELDYIVLPDAVKTMIRKEWGSLKDASGKTIAMKQGKLARQKLIRIALTPIRVSTSMNSLPGKIDIQG